VPQLRHAVGDELGDGPGLVHAAVDFDERPLDLVAERAARELFGVGRRGEARLHGDAGVQRGAGDSGPAEL
jgi:hypothetical protein